MSSEIPIFVTQFRDFELEERVVRLIARRGFQIGERKIVGARDLALSEILITDQDLYSEELPVISIPKDAWQWSDLDLEKFVQHQILPPLPGAIENHVLLSGGENFSDLREEILTALYESGHSALFVPFDENDLRTALIPTRRREERVRFDRFVQASKVLFMLKLEDSASFRNEIARAQSLIEYRRRVHPQLQLGFLVIGGRKAKRAEVAALFEPFRVFFVADPRDELVRIWSRKAPRGGRKYREIEEWIGSSHGDSGKLSDLQDRASPRGTRSPRRVGSPVATSRRSLFR